MGEAACLGRKARPCGRNGIAEAAWGSVTRNIFCMNNEQAVKPNIKQAMPFFWVSDMAASLRFYVNGLGFTMANKWEPRGTIEWCWLQRDGVALMLQEY